jgi:hypothetical protein
MPSLENHDELSRGFAEAKHLDMRGLSPKAPEFMREKAPEQHNQCRANLRRKIRPSHSFHQDMHDAISDAKANRRHYSETPTRFLMWAVAFIGHGSIKPIRENAAADIANQCGRHRAPAKKFHQTHQERIMHNSRNHAHTRESDDLQKQLRRIGEKTAHPFCIALFCYRYMSLFGFPAAHYPAIANA